MTWENVGPVLVSAFGIAVALGGLMLTLGRIFRPWMRNEAQAAAAQVSAKVDALADKLSTNDFPHMEIRIERRTAEVRADLGGRLEDMGGRLDRAREDMGRRLEDMGKRLDRALEDMGGRLEDMGKRLDRAREDRAAMENRLGARIERSEAHLLAAIQAIRGRDAPKVSEGIRRSVEAPGPREEKAE